MNDELEKNYELLRKTFEEILVEKFAISELRDFWRCRAGVKLPTETKKLTNENNG